MGDGVKKIMAKMLAEWLFRDFWLLLEKPTEEDIEGELEEHE